MPDREKVIKGLKDIQKHLDTGYSFTISWESKLIRDAIELIKNLEAQLQHACECYEEAEKELKKQESTTFKPRYIDEYGSHFICGVECGSCHEKISKTYHYCPYCGKAVKWE